MIYDFVFKQTKLRKSEFLNWLINEMISEGWVNQSADKTNIDFYSMYSTGESGEDKIGVHIRPWADRASEVFASTVYGRISAKPYHTYTPNPSLTGAGTYSPVGAWTEFRVTGDVDVRTEINVYYHINKDRAIVVTEHSNHVHVLSSTFFVLGKPHELAKSDEFSKSAVICSHGNYICRSGILDYDTEKSHHTSAWHFALYPKMKKDNIQQAQDILVSNVVDGIKYRVENIFQTNFHYSNVKVYTYDLNKNIYIDKEGNKYRLFSHNMTTNLTHAELRNFMIRVE